MKGCHKTMHLAHFSFVRKQNNLSGSFPSRLSLASHCPGLSHSPSPLQWRLETHMSGERTKTVTTGPNLRVGTLPPGKDEGETGERQLLQAQWGGGGLFTFTERRILQSAGHSVLGRDFDPTHHTSLSASLACSVDVSSPTCLPRWAVSSMGSVCFSSAQNASHTVSV